MHFLNLQLMLLISHQQQLLLLLKCKSTGYVIGVPLSSTGLGYQQEIIEQKEIAIMCLQTLRERKRKKERERERERKKERERESTFE